MGYVFSKLFNGSFQEQIRILMLGLDAAGKTTMLYKLKLGEVVTSIPTIGLNLETLECNKLKFTVWDLGGSMRIRSPYKPFYQNIDALTFVVDSSDPERIEDVISEFQNLLQLEELEGCPILILANKQDRARMSISEITEHLQLQKLKRSWLIQGTCACTGEGLQEGLDWLAKTLKTKQMK